MALVLLLSGCTRWDVVAVTPAPTDTLDHARVFAGGRPAVLVDNVVVSADSVTGLLPNSSPPGHPPQRFLVLRAEVDSIYQPHHDLLRTLGLSTLPPAFLAGGWFLLGL